MISDLFKVVDHQLEWKQNKDTHIALLERTQELHKFDLQKKRPLSLMRCVNFYPNVDCWN